MGPSNPIGLDQTHSNGTLKTLRSFIRLFVHECLLYFSLPKFVHLSSA